MIKNIVQCVSTAITAIILSIQQHIKWWWRSSRINCFLFGCSLGILKYDAEHHVYVRYCVRAYCEKKFVCK